MTETHNVYLSNTSPFIIINDTSLARRPCGRDSSFERHLISIDMNMIKSEVRLPHCKLLIIRSTLLTVLVYWHGHFINTATSLVEQTYENGYIVCMDSFRGWHFTSIKLA